MARETATELVLAPPALCTDNAAMAALAWEHFDRQAFAPLDLDATPGLFAPRQAAAGGQEVRLSRYAEIVVQ